MEWNECGAACLRSIEMSAMVKKIKVFTCRYACERERKIPLRKENVAISVWKVK
jgi:hypothetical protein